MNNFDRDDIIHSKKVKLAILAAVFIGGIIMIFLDCLAFNQKWG